MRAWIAASAFAFVAAPAWAGPGDVWDTTFGRVVWERNIDHVAVFSYEAPSGEGDARIFIDGLGQPGREDVGQEFYGFWIEYDSTEYCRATMLDELGGSSRNWGSFRIRFEGMQTSGRWVAHWGYCFDPAEGLWDASVVDEPGQGEPSDKAR